MDKENSSSASYWKASLALVGKLLIVWFFVSFGCGILFKEQLDEYSVGGPSWILDGPTRFHPLLRPLLITYSHLMNKLDEKHGFYEEE